MIMPHGLGETAALAPYLFPGEPQVGHLLTEVPGLLAMASRGTGVTSMIRGGERRAIPRSKCLTGGFALASRSHDGITRTVSIACVWLLHEPCSLPPACLACSMCPRHPLGSNIPKPHALGRPHRRLRTSGPLLHICNFYPDSDTNAFSGRYTSVHMLYC